MGAPEGAPPVELQPLQRGRQQQLAEGGPEAAEACRVYSNSSSSSNNNNNEDSSSISSSSISSSSSSTSIKIIRVLCVWLYL